MQRKKLKRLIYVIVAVWIIVLLTGILFSRSFQDAVIESLSEQADDQLLVEVHLRRSNVHFSVLKKFPLASVELRNVIVKTPRHVEIISSRHGDTLLHAEKLFLQLDLRSILSKKYELKKITINNGYLQIIQDKKGHSSLEIIKSNGKTGDFTAQIESFTLNNVEIFSYSPGSKFETLSYIKKGSASGSFSGKNFFVQVKGNGRIQQLKSNNTNFLNNQQCSIDIAIRKTASHYTINKGKISIGNIPMKIIGSLEYGENPLTDVVLSANNAPIKHLDDQLLQGILGRTGFEPRSGNLDLQASVKGYVKRSMPRIQIDYTVSKGKIFDKKHDVLFNDIFIQGEAINWQGQKSLRSIKVRVDSFSFLSGNSAQHGKLELINLNNPRIVAQCRGHIHANDLKKIYTPEQYSISGGKINNDITIRGNLTKKNNKSNLETYGIVFFDNVEIQSNEIPNLLLNLLGKITVRNNQSYKLDSFQILTKKSDVLITGSFENRGNNSPYRSFKGTVQSNLLVIDEFRNRKPEDKVRTIRFPDSLEFNGSVKINKLIADNYKPENISGNVTYKPGSLSIANMHMNSFSGKILSNINISQFADNSFSLNIHSTLKNARIEELFSSFNNFNQQVISDQHLNGKLSGEINFRSKCDHTFKLHPPSIIAQGNLLLQDGELKDYDPLLGLSRFIEVEELKHIRFDNLTTTISIKNRKITLDQTHIASSAITFDGSGVHDFDNKYSYSLQVGLSDILWKKARKKRSDINEFGYVVENDAKRTVVPFLITGKGSSFDVKYDKRTSRKSFKQKVEDEKEELRNLFGNTKKEIPLETEPEKQEDEKPQPIMEKKNDSGVYQHKSENFMIEWEDDEDDDEN